MFQQQVISNIIKNFGPKNT